MDSPPAGHRPAHVKGAGGVVFDPRGRVLLIRHRNGNWVFPKGHLDPGEDHVQAALREVEEEAGVRATCRNPERTWTTEYVNPRRERRHITWFRLDTDEEQVEMREPLFPEGAFLPPDEALEKLTFDEDRELLRRVLGRR